MRYFREQGKSDHEVIEALNAKFGDNYQIMSRKTVKLGGIFGVGRRTGVEYFGYILGKATLGTGSRLSHGNTKTTNIPNEDWYPEAQPHPNTAYATGKKQHTESTYFPISEQDLAERDKCSRDEILARFAKNKEVQRLLHEKKLVLDSKPKLGTTLPPVPHLKDPVQLGPSNGSIPSAKNPGFTPIHDPAQVSSMPKASEYASVNYDILTAPSRLQNENQQDDNNQNHDHYAQDIPINLQQGGSTGQREIGTGAKAQNLGTQVYQSSFPNSLPDQGAYSSNSASPYQRNLDQIEASFLHRLENLERKLDRRGSMSEPASLGQLRKSMYHNEFPPFFVDRLVIQMKRELPLEELEKLEVLWEYVLLHIAENMRFIDVQQQSHSRIMVLVGPTGVGKTTTIAKLAARQCVEAMGGIKKVHLITLDNYRIGAQDQIRTYGEILGARVDCVETTEGLATCIAQDQESDMILVDTMGRSPSDHMKLAEMRHFLEYSGNCEIHLTMSATSGASALKEIIIQFKPFGFRSVILTKLDELGRIGGTLATFLQEDIPLSYVTTGQKVPQDIRPASALVLFRQLTDVQLNWPNFAQKLEENMF